MRKSGHNVSALSISSSFSVVFVGFNVVPVIGFSVTLVVSSGGETDFVGEVNGEDGVTNDDSVGACIAP